MQVWSFPRRYAEWAVRRPWTLLLGSILLALGLGGFALTQRYHDPYELWFVEGDPDLASYHQLLRQYGRDDFVLIAFKEPAGIFTNRALAAVLDLTERLEAMPSVDRVDAITNHQRVRARRTTAGEDELSIEDLVKREELPFSAEQLAQLERTARQEPGVLGSLVGGRAERDGRLTTAAVIARILIDEGQSGTATPIVETILRAAREIETTYGYRLYIAGVPVVEHTFRTFGWTETIKFVPLLLITVAILLAVVTRSLRGLVVPVTVIVLSIVPTLGMMALLGIWLNPLTTIVPQIIIAVGIADAVHLVASFQLLRAHGHGRAESAIVMLERNFVPCLVTSLTTMVGFASLLIASVAPVRQLGVSAAIGVSLAWLLTMTLAPAVLMLWPGRSGRPPSARLEAADRALAWIAGLVSRRPVSVVVGFAVVFLGLASFIAHVRVETSYKNMFKPETVLRQGLAFIDANVGGTVDLEISIDSGQSDGVKDPAFLAKVETLQAFLKAQPAVTHSFSIVDVLKRMNTAMNDEDPAFNRIPDTREQTAQYLLLYTLSSRRVDLKERIDVDNRWTRLSARVLVTSSDETRAFGGDVRRFIADRLPGLRANVTGKALLYATMQDKLRESAFNSFATAFGIITVVMAVTFRSVKVGLLSLIPNVLPVLGTVGVMGLLDIPLDPGSATVACIGIGIAVDDTVHFLSKYLAHRASHAPADAVRLTLAESGRPIVFTSVILAIGFSLFAFSHFNFIAYFGQLATVLIMFALAADLLLLPAMMILVDSGRPGGARVGVSERVRRWRLRTSGVAVLAASFLLPGPAAAETPEERGRAIMAEQERVNRGYRSEVGRYRMILINANGDRSERVLEMRTLEGPDEGDRTLIVFRAPADISGTGLLTHQHRGRDDDQWLYLPALRRVRRIASATRSSSFVGSEFSYEDLVPAELDRYRYRYLRDDTLGDAAVWVIESVPQFKESGYSRIEVFVRQDNHQTVRRVFYDRKGSAAKEARFEHWTRIDNRWWRARTIRMDNLQTRKSTVLELQELKTAAGLSVDDFTTRALER